jgi:hypothetical protein
MESVKRLRDMLMAYEWELHGKELAGRRCACVRARARACMRARAYVSTACQRRHVQGAQIVCTHARV